MKTPIPTELNNRHVTVRPIAMEHAAAFAEIGNDPSIWTYLAPEPFECVADAQVWINTMLTTPEFAVTYSVFDAASGKLAGSTTYLNCSEKDDSIEIGFTWYGKQYQRTCINTATKHLLLAHAFEELGAVRVQLRTDARNMASQNAIARIGGVKEGVLRKHKKYPNGFARDTVVFSILKDEWAAVSRKLNDMLPA